MALEDMIPCVHDNSGSEREEKWEVFTVMIS
jgi:hypothetical protein